MDQMEYSPRKKLRHSFEKTEEYGGKIQEKKLPKDRKEASSDSLPQTVQDIILPGIMAEKKHVPHWYLYDTNGSKLFDRVAMHNSHYNVYKAEMSIIKKYAGEITDSIVGPKVIVSELGAGSSTKTVYLLKTLLENREDVEFVPVDVAKEFIEENAKLFRKTYEGLVVTPFPGDFEDGIKNLKRYSKPVLLLFLGSTFGTIPFKNMTSFLLNAKYSMKESDRFIIGIDLMQDAKKLEIAYTHPLTAIPFNKNVLTRLNRDFDADFDLDNFELHFDYIISEDTEVFSHPQYVVQSLQCLNNHTIHLKTVRKELAMKKGEKIQLNCSVKWNWSQFTELIEKTGLHLEKKWINEDNSFGLACIRTN